MTNNTESDKQPRTITISFIVGWVLGIIFALGGMILILTQPLSGFLMIALAAVLLPPITQMISTKLNISLSGPLRFVIVVILVIAISLSADDPQAGGIANETRSEAPSERAEVHADSAQSQEPAAENDSFGNGTHVIGTDIEPGTYRSSGSGMCYWARLSGFGGELGDIIANGNNAPEIVTIAATDEAFNSMGCGDWQPVENTFPEMPSSSFSDGTFVVGEHIAPGRYRADGSPDRLCYWARLSNFSRGGVDGIITNGNSPTVIEISPNDQGFTTFGCGTWSQI